MKEQSIEQGKYIIREDGTVYSVRSKKVLTPVKHNQGYLCVSLGANNKRLLHRLIAETLIPNPDNKPCVNHIDGNKHNNATANLEWCTYTENHLHAFRIGLRENPTGIELGTAKLSAEDVRWIRTNLEFGHKELGVCPLARRFNVSPATVRDAYYGKRYKSIV